MYYCCKAHILAMVSKLDAGNA